MPELSERTLLFVSPPSDAFVCALVSIAFLSRPSATPLVGTFCYAFSLVRGVLICTFSLLTRLSATPFVCTFCHVFSLARGDLICTFALCACWNKSKIETTLHPSPSPCSRPDSTHWPDMDSAESEHLCAAVRSHASLLAQHQREVGDLGEEIRGLAKNQEDFRGAIATQVAKLGQQMQEVLSLLNAGPAATSSTPVASPVTPLAIAPMTGSARLAPPERYSGEPGLSRAFITECEMHFESPLQSTPPFTLGRSSRWWTVRWCQILRPLHLRGLWEVGRPTPLKNYWMCAEEAGAGSTWWTGRVMGRRSGNGCRLVIFWTRDFLRTFMRLTLGLLGRLGSGPRGGGFCHAVAFIFPGFCLVDVVILLPVLFCRSFRFSLCFLPRCWLSCLP
nr:uncharacterized protein LOC125990993 [Syngnathus scovelli]